MKANYITPSMVTTDLTLDVHMKVDSIDGGTTGIRLGGGEDPSTGRTKDRDVFIESENEVENDKMSLW